MVIMSINKARYDKAFFKAVGNAVRRRRELMMLSIDDLGQLVNLRANYIEELEGGLRNINLSTLGKVCKALNCAVSQLLLEAETAITPREDAS